MPDLTLHSNSPYLDPHVNVNLVRQDPVRLDGSKLKVFADIINVAILGLNLKVWIYNENIYCGAVQGWKRAESLVILGCLKCARRPPPSSTPACAPWPAR